jgi:hypothetical protein
MEKPLGILTISTLLYVIWKHIEWAADLDMANPAATDVGSCSKAGDHLKTNACMAEQWTTWKDEFMLYITLAMGDKSDSQKIGLLQYLIGKEGRAIMNTFKLNAENPDTYTLAKVVKRFDENVVAKRNVTVERYKLFTRNQGEAESLDNYITELKKLGGTCELGELEESLVRTMLIIGVQNSSLRERMLNTEQTLEESIQMCRANEMTRANKQAIEGKEQQEPVHAVKQRGGNGPTTRKYAREKETARRYGREAQDTRKHGDER